MKRNLLLLLSLFVLGVLTVVQFPAFLNPTNGFSLGARFGIYGVFTLGTALVLWTGGVDLSVGALLAFTGVVLAQALTNWPSHGLLVCAAVLLGGCAVGFLHGLLVMRYQWLPVLVTLGGYFVYRQFARWLAQGRPTLLPEHPQLRTLHHFVAGAWHGVPVPLLIFLLLACGLGLILWLTPYGSYLTVPAAAQNARLTTLSAYAAAGGLTALAGIFLAGFTVSVDPGWHGRHHEFYALAAALLGGFKFRGGRGTLLGLGLGLAVLLVGLNYLNLCGWPSSWNFILLGAFVLPAAAWELCFEPDRNFPVPAPTQD